MSNASLDEQLSKVANTPETNKALKASAFPGRQQSLGYAQGLTKLEWLTAHLYVTLNDVAAAVEVAKEIIATCDKETK